MGDEFKGKKGSGREIEIITDLKRKFISRVVLQPQIWWKDLNLFRFLMLTSVKGNITVAFPHYLSLFPVPGVVKWHVWKGHQSGSSATSASDSTPRRSVHICCTDAAEKQIFHEMFKCNTDIEPEHIEPSLLHSFRTRHVDICVHFLNRKFWSGDMSSSPNLSLSVCKILH